MYLIVFYKPTRCQVFHHKAVIFCIELTQIQSGEGGLITKVGAQSMKKVF